MSPMDIYAESALHNTDVLPYGDDTFQVVDEAQGGVIAYCHASTADRIVAALKASDPRTTAASTLGTVIGALGPCNPDATVLLDYRGELVNPGKPTYYRSYHDELALTPDGTKPVKVAEMLDTLRDIRVFGFTRPGRETGAPDYTNVWVAKHRDPSGLRVVGVRNDGGTIVVLTEDQG
jgi:hypothetical protein